MFVVENIRGEAGIVLNDVNGGIKNTLKGGNKMGNNPFGKKHKEEIKEI